ncbi:flavin reductase family protein [Celerinatantimonas sp. YJH-8]|uniref:flavin reductase family protein n=1 Tax=Celerinatantimonas sp. YJH-8 TaxID=3228714 RepID=UPI0038CA86D4
MSSAMQFYEPAKGHPFKHDPFKSIIAPRPIGWISSRSANGVDNLAPYSFFNAFAGEPPIIGFSSAGWKDSVQNIQETGEFCWNMTTKSLAEQMNLSSAPIASGQSEFELAGLTVAESKLVRAPRVAESPVSFECRLTQLIRLNNAEQVATDYWLVLGEVVGVYIAQDLLEDGMFQMLKAEPILRAGGPSTYFSLSQETQFEMFRPTLESVERS